MITTHVCKIGGDDIRFFQAETLEEARKQGLPQGLHYYWEVGNRRVYVPAEITALVQEAAAAGTLEAAALTRPERVRTHYQDLLRVQHARVTATLQDLRRRYISQGMAEPVLKELDKNIAQHAQAPALDEDGMHRPDRLGVQELFGRAAAKQYDDLSRKGVLK